MNQSTNNPNIISDNNTNIQFEIPIYYEDNEYNLLV